MAAITSVSLLLALAVAIGGLVAFRRYGRLKSYSKLQDKLLADHVEELDTLRRVWQISAEDVELLHRIDGGSEGAFGEVWLAAWHGRQVAIKRLRLALQELDPSAVEGFDVEVQTLKTMRHRNIVLFYGAGIMESSPFLVAEYMENGSLRHMLSTEGKSLPWSRRWSFALDIASGMRYLHSLAPPRLHRDLKCANVLVTADYVCKLGDFGTAKLLHQLRRESQDHCAAQHRGRFFRAGRAPSYSVEMPTTSFSAKPAPAPPLLEPSEPLSGFAAGYTMTTSVGTFLWTAPEVLSEKPYGLPADVYSYAVVLAELADPSVMPFNDLQVPMWELRRLITEEQRRPHLPEDTPKAWRELAEICWRHNPAERLSFDLICHRLQEYQEK